MKHDLKILAAASLGLLSVATSTAFAEDAAPAGPTLGSVLEASGITASGYVAASYYHSSGYNLYHLFDGNIDGNTHQTFQLDQASLQLAYQPKEGFGALVQVIGGEDATLLTSGSSSKVAVAQAYAQYVGGPLTVIAGKYWTLAGAEVTPVSGNTNFSRSLLFTYEPAYHTGVRATVAASDMFSFTLGVNNGWYSYADKVTNGASDMTGEVGVSFTPVKAFSLLASGYFGKDASYDAQRSLFDLVATFNATDALSFILSYDNGQQKQVAGPTLKWDGIAAYVNVAFNDMWRLSVRGEQFKDKDGVNLFGAGNEVEGVDAKISEVTLTVGFAPVKSYELRAEVRRDWSNKDAAKGYADGLFVDYAGNSTDKQTEFALQGVYKF